MRRFYEFQKKLPGGGRGALLTCKRLRARTAGWTRVMRSVLAFCCRGRARCTRLFPNPKPGPLLEAAIPQNRDLALKEGKKDEAVENLLGVRLR